MSSVNIISHLKKLCDPARATHSLRFFKTGVGEYGEGDKFLGLTVPQIRSTVNQFWRKLTLAEVDQLLASSYHEHRLTGLLLLVKQYEKGDDEIKKAIYDFYLTHLSRINNWDLVDLSAPNIIGDYLLTRSRSILYKLAKSKNLWQRRVAILSTFTFIRDHQFKDALSLATILLADPHDLIHKAVGWMLREIGKRDLFVLTAFLDSHAHHMPRTMLRYAIEKLPPLSRQHYLTLKPQLGIN